MPIESPDSRPGYLFATEGIDRAIECADGFCANQEAYVSASNQPEIQVLKARGSLLCDERQRLCDRLAELDRATQHSSDHARIWNAAVASALTVAAFFFALMTFGPFKLGWTPYVYCVGFAIVGIFAIDHFLSEWPNPKVLKVASVVLLSAALPSIVLLAMVRGDVLAHSLKADAPVIIDDTTSEQSPSDDTADRTVLLLRIAMVLAALGFELAAGLAVHEFRSAQQVIDNDPVPQLRRDLANVEAELLSTIHRVAELESQPAVFRAMFWRDFHLGLITSVIRRIATRNLVVLALLAAAAFFPTLRAADRLDLVALLDLSQTELAKGAPGNSEFDQNVRALSTLLVTLPPGACVTVLGITGDSFATPYVLLSAQLAEDPGPFSARLQAGRRMIGAAWSKKARSLAPIFLHTDVLGGVLYADQILSQSSANHKVILALSDMRHQAHGLNLESPKTIDVANALKYVAQQQLVARLAGVDVYVFGGGDHSGNRDTAYWTSLKGFWLEYFRRCGATLRWFSPGRERDALLRVATAEPEQTGATRR